MATTQSTQNNDWFKSQQQYWDNWFESQRKFFGEQTLSPSAANAQGPWAEFFKAWQNTVSGSQKTPDTEAFQQCFAKAGETYMNMLQQFYQATGQSKPLDQMTREWTENLQKFFADALHKSSQPFDMPAFQGGKDPFSAVDPLGFFASIPGIGYTREKQEQWNHLYQQWTDYDRKSRAYNAGMAKVGLEAVQKFQEYLANPPKDAEPLKSLKDIYTKWVDVCEEIYARYAMSEEYTKLYGDTVNALMEFKKRQNQAMDDLMDQLNLPTRQEVDSLHRQVHALKKELAALKPKTAIKTAKSGKKGKKK